MVVNAMMRAEPGRPGMHLPFRFGMEVDPRGIHEQHRSPGHAEPTYVARAEQRLEPDSHGDGDGGRADEGQGRADPGGERPGAGREGDQGEAGSVEQFEESDDGEDEDEPGSHAQVGHLAKHLCEVREEVVHRALTEDAREHHGASLGSPGTRSRSAPPGSRCSSGSGR